MVESSLSLIDDGMFALGLVLGLLAGSLIALLRLPHEAHIVRKPLRRAVQEKLTAVDPVARSIAEGKATARQRQADLGR